MKKAKISVFREWLNKQPSTNPTRRKQGLPMSVPEFVEESKKRGVLNAKANTLYNNSKEGSVPRNIEYYEKAWQREGIRF